MSTSAYAISFYGVAWKWGTKTSSYPLGSIDEDRASDREGRDAAPILQAHKVYAGQYGNSFTGETRPILYIPESMVRVEESAALVKTGEYHYGWRERIETVLDKLGMSGGDLEIGWYVAGGIW